MQQWLICLHLSKSNKNLSQDKIIFFIGDHLLWDMEKQLGIFTLHHIYI